MSQSPELLVRGSLRQTPLAEFLVQAYDNAMEGTLLLQTREREKSAILFIRGAPAKARPARKTIFLGEVAVELGLVSESVAATTQKRAEAEKRTHGSVLREEGHLDEASLYVALREQLFRQVLVLSGLPDTTGFGFYRANYLADWGDAGQWRVKPLPMIWRALVDHLPESRREAWLRRLGDTPLRIRSNSPVSRYHLSKEELGVLDMLRAKVMPVEQLTHCGVGSPAFVRRVACALLLSRQIEVGSEKEPVGLGEPPETQNSVAPPEGKGVRRTTAPRAPGAPRISSAGQSLPPGFSLPPGGSMAPRVSTAKASPQAETSSLPPASARDSTAPSSKRTGARTTGVRSLRTQTSRRPPSSSDAPNSTEQSQALRKEIEAYREREPKNHYQVLGVEKNADAATIRTAFFQLAKRWHPDRLPSGLEDLLPFVTQTFSEMGEAHQTLLDDKKRAEYNKLLENTPDDEQAQVAAILQAANAFQRAEILLKKKDMVGALREAKAAYEGDPTQADHAALYAWVQGTQRSEGLGDLIHMLDAAIKADGENIRAYWYRGQLYKKAGETLKAIKDFKKIVSLKPNHVDARRELRVYSMRKRSDPHAGGKAGAGLFGVFKKKD